jgi:hypothetical protein
VLSGVIAAQVALQGLAFASGLILVHWLSIKAYAEYSVTFGFGASVALLVDLGFAGSVISLVGDRVADADVVGNYIRVGRRMRNRALSVGIPLGAVVFHIVVRRQGWPLVEQAGLYATVVATLLGRSILDYYSLPLLMHRDYVRFYTPQIVGTAVRVLATAAAFAAGVLSAIVASALNAAVFVANGVRFRSSVKERVREPLHSDPAYEKEMRHYVAPLIPGLVYVAFQGQVGVLLASLVGATRSVAEVGALSRLGQVFLVPAALAGVVVIPYIAASAASRVRRRMAVVMALATAGVGSICLATFLFPHEVLFVLGRRYSQLGAAVGWAMVASGLSYLSGTVYALNFARRFVYYWGTLGGPLASIGAQALVIVLFDVHTTLGIQFVLVTSTCVELAFNCAGTIYGFRRGPRIGRKDG